MEHSDITKLIVICQNDELGHGAIMNWGMKTLWVGMLGPEEQQTFPLILDMQ